MTLLTKLHTELHRIRRLRRNPAPDCYRLQRQVLAIIVAAEKEIQNRKARTQKDRYLLRGGPEERLSKTEAVAVKARIQTHHDAVARARWRLTTARTLIDALAFMFLPKWDMKPLSWKEPPGFISGKEGLKLELQVLHEVATKLNRVAILNDLTQCLRYGDLTIAAGPPVFIEVKSGRGDTERDKRQQRHAESVSDYLRRDLTHNWRNTGFTVRRVPLLIPERHHRRLLGKLILRACRFGFALTKVEAGLHYLALGESSVGEAVMRLRERLCDPMAFPLFGNFPPPYYVPLSLSIDNTTAWWKVATGEVSLLVIIDKAQVVQSFASTGLVAEWVETDDAAGPGWSLHSPQMPEVSPFRVSSQFFARVAGEFLSLQWFIDETVASFRRVAQAGLQDFAVAGDFSDGSVQ